MIYLIIQDIFSVTFPKPRKTVIALYIVFSYRESLENNTFHWLENRNDGNNLPTAYQIKIKARPT